MGIAKMEAALLRFVSSLTLRFPQNAQKLLSLQEKHAFKIIIIILCTYTLNLKNISSLNEAGEEDQHEITLEWTMSTVTKNWATISWITIG